MSTYRTGQTHRGIPRRISRQQHLKAIFSSASYQNDYTVYQVGICGTCGRPAPATGANEGYSDCCNDRIEYDLEAAETVQHCIDEQVEYLVVNKKKIASLASQVSKKRKAGIDVAGIERELQSARQWQKIAKQDIRDLQKIQKEM